MCLIWRADAKLVYTYDVYWELSDISWASRWDAYLRMPGGRVHWFSILNSLMVVLVMSSIVAMIMMRTIRRDLARYEGILGEAGARPPSPRACPPQCSPASTRALYIAWLVSALSADPLHLAQQECSQLPWAE